MAGGIRAFLISIRVSQWVKNLFVLAPLLFGRKITDPQAAASAVLATVAFCFVSGAVYVLNDLMDAASDREHPAKRLRPIAAGALSPGLALVGALVLVGTSLALGSRAGRGFLLVLFSYFLLMLAYSVALKKVPVLDAMVIATGFVLRVLGGAEAVGVRASHWLIVCAFLLALYMAFAKRRQELLSLASAASNHRRVLGEYSIAYLEQVNTILMGATIVCYALYTVAPDTVARFGTDRLLYGTVFVIYGLLRYLALAQNTSLTGDPSRLVVRDTPLLLAVLGWVLYNAAVIYSHAGA